MWFKYRSKWSYSVPNSWEYIEARNEDDMKEELREMSQNEDSYYFRGWEFEKIDRPPDKWLLDRIDDLKTTSHYAAKTAKRYEDMISGTETK